MMTMRLTPAVKVLTLSCLAVFLLQKLGDEFFGTHFLTWFGLVPELSVNQGRLWQLLTYSFLHGDVTHLVLNLLMLVFIGSELEALWGRRRFLFFYFFCVIAAGISYLLLQALVWQGSAPMVGASGGIYGLLLAYGLVLGDRILLFMMLFPMKARHFIWVLAGVEFLSGLSAQGSGGALSSVAHLGGMAAGFVYLYGRGWWLVRQRRQGAKSSRSTNRVSRAAHLKLVKTDSREAEDEGPKTWH
jgi:membrane associated rhomboid family serine protease